MDGRIISFNEQKKSIMKRFINFFFAFTDNIDTVAFSITLLIDLVCFIYTEYCEKAGDNILNPYISFWSIAKIL